MHVVVIAVAVLLFFLLAPLALALFFGSLDGLVHGFGWLLTKMAGRSASGYTAEEYFGKSRRRKR